MLENSPRERFHTVLAGGLPDCVPVMVEIDSQFATKHAGRRLSAYYKDSSVRVESLLFVQERFGLGVLWQGVQSAQYIELFGGECEYRDDAVPIPKAPVFGCIADLEGIRLPDLDEITPFRVSLETTQALSRHLGGTIAIGGSTAGVFNVAQALVGSEKLLRGFRKDREFVLRVADLSCNIAVKVAEAQAEAGAQFIYYPDAVSSPAMISPALYRDVAASFHKRFFAAVKPLGIPVIYHPCGPAYQILCQVLGLNDVGAFHFSEMVDPSVVRQIGGPETVLVGSVNPTTLMMGTPEEVEVEVQTIVKNAGKRGRLLVGVGCTMPPDTPTANLEMLIQSTGKHGRYPI